MTAFLDSEWESNVRHEPVRKASHHLYIEGFNFGGPTGMIAIYSGPDTKGFVLMKGGVACSLLKVDFHAEIFQADQV